MRYYFLIALTVLMNLTVVHAASVIAPATSPIGQWKTIDDITGQPKSIVEIYENPDKTLSGKVIKIFAKTNKAESLTCKACEGDKKNQPIVGMVILTGLTQNKNSWDNGTILDPVNGKNYHSMVRIVNQGKKILVRGYLGLPVFGRSQVWERI